MNVKETKVSRKTTELENIFPLSLNCIITEYLGHSNYSYTFGVSHGCSYYRCTGKHICKECKLREEWDEMGLFHGCSITIIFTVNSSSCKSIIDDILDTNSKFTSSVIENLGWEVNKKRNKDKIEKYVENFRKSCIISWLTMILQECFHTRYHTDQIIPRSQESVASRNTHLLFHTLVV